MDNQDQKGVVSHLVAVLRKMTRIMQVLPFAYLLILAVYLLTESVLPDWTLRVADNVLNVPCMAILGMIGIGRILKLCVWHRAACLLPISTKVESYVDSFVITFTQNEVILFNTCLGILFLGFIAFAYRHFFAK